LPSIEWGSSPGHIYGYGGSLGFVRLAAETALSAGR
jgi:hypothetical protein